MIRFLLAFSFLFLTIKHAYSQQVLQNLGHSPIIAGIRVGCSGAVTVVAYVNDIAYAKPGVIYLNPKFFDLPGYVQLYIYAHECGHQMVGSNESAADCWAVKTGRNQGWLPPEGMDQVCRFTFPSSGDWTHMPGPQRCAQMVACYNSY